MRKHNLLHHNRFLLPPFRMYAKIDTVMETIRSYIEEKRLSVEELADLVDIDKATVYRHLKGQKFKLETARKYSAALSVPLEYFLCQVA